MKTLIGKVTSDKMLKTVVVTTERFVSHPLYRKRMRRNTTLHAHNEIGAKLGDVVKIGETSPISKTKNWKVIEVMNKNGTA